VERLRVQPQKQQATGKRQGGDRRQAERHQVLGQLRKSLDTTLKAASVVLEARPPWSGVHNHGGTAGKGGKTKIPVRTYLEVVQETAAALAGIALDHFFGRKH